MKFRTTIVLLVLVIGLGAFLLIYTARQPTASAIKEDQSRLYAEADFREPGSSGMGGLSDLATKLELRNGKSEIELERAAGGLSREWRIVKPLDLPADSGAVTAILGEIEFAQVARRLAPEKDRPLDLKSYGLEPAERSIRFSVGEKSWTLNIGAKTPDGQSVYVAREDARTPSVCIVPASLLEKASEGVNDLRDKAALRFDKEAVTRVELVPAGGPALTLSKEATCWRLSGAVQDVADPDAVVRLGEALAGLRVDAADFVTDRPGARAADFGLDKPRFKLTVLDGTASRTLLIGADVKDHADKCYAKREGDDSVFALDKEAVEGIMKTAADLRSKLALDFSPDQVTEIAIKPAAEQGRPSTSPAGKPARTVRLVRPNDQWTMEEPAGVTADPEQALLFLNDLHNLEVADWVDNPTPERVADCGLAAPKMTISLRTQPEAAPMTLLFGKPADKPQTCYARRGGEGPILVVPDDLLARLAAGPLLFVSRTMLEFNKEDAVAVRIVRPEGAVALEQRGGRWTVVAPAAAGAKAGEPAPAEANIPRVENLLYGLAFLDAKRVEAEKAGSLGAYGLDAPRIKVTVSLKPADAAAGPSPAPPAVKTLLIGKELPDGDSYAMIEGGERIFVLKGASVNLFLVDFVKAGKPAPAKGDR